MSERSIPTLHWLLERLAEAYGAPPQTYPTDPFELVLWENVAYLADDAHRREALESLRSTIGTRPEQVLNASRSQLVEVARHGILAEQFASKLRSAAELALREFDGDLHEVLRMPAAAAKRALRKFPGIGDPGAEKILLFTRSKPFLAPDSNALRVLVRFGVCAEGKSYAATYAAARDAAATGLGADFDVLIAARYHLRRHGQEICRRTAPRCPECVARRRCPFPEALAVAGGV